MQTTTTRGDRGGRLRLAVAIATVSCAVALVHAPSAVIAGGAACEKWDGAVPSKLSKKQARKAVVCSINRERAAAGLPAVARSKRLQKAAQSHARRMQRGHCLSHQCPGEPALEERLRERGYITDGLLRFGFGEVIGFGGGRRGTPAAMVAAWMGSPLHRAQVLGGAFRDVGVGFARHSSNAAYYTAVFGFRVG
jgi:uncharacterized protein YkwD